jgi:hypothetical protein
MDMLKKGQLRMIDHEERSAANERNFSTKLSCSRFPTMAPVKELKTVFDVICHCRMPESYGNALECDACKRSFHLQCYLIHESNIFADTLSQFVCYDCREEGQYSFLEAKGCQPSSHAEILRVAEAIKGLPKSKFGRFHGEVFFGRKNEKLFVYMKDYMQFEKIIAKYDLNCAGKMSGPIFGAVFSFFNAGAVSLGCETSFKSLNVAQIIHLSSLLICEATQSECLPLWTKEKDVQIDLTEDADDSKRWIKQLEKSIAVAKRGSEKLLKSGKTLAEAMSTLSYLKKEVSDVENYASQLLVKKSLNKKHDKDVLLLRTILEECKVCSDLLFTFQNQ